MRQQLIDAKQMLNMNEDNLQTFSLLAPPVFLIIPFLSCFEWLYYKIC